MENVISDEFKIVEEPRKPLAMDPKKFALWLFLATVVMLFAALTSAYIVKRADGSWREFELPGIFIFTSIAVVLSSLTMHGAYLAARKDNLGMVKTLVVVTAILGITFLIGQVVGWSQLLAEKVHFSGGNTSESFVYLLTGLHGAHLISAIIFLIIVLVAVFRFQVHSRRLNQLEMCVTYWHFLGGLWIYLYIFMLNFR
jgi:cytochrome c oxidase subunit 3